MVNTAICTRHEGDSLKGVLLGLCRRIVVCWMGYYYAGEDTTIWGILSDIISAREREREGEREEEKEKEREGERGREEREESDMEKER